MGCTIRRNDLVTQRVEVALIYKEMLGVAEAMAYLESEGISKDLAERVLFSRQRQRRRVEEPAPRREFSQQQFVHCRRKNRVQDAIVEAALKIETTLGIKWALALLKDEKVPDEVANRILACGPRQVRAKTPPQG